MRPPGESMEDHEAKAASEVAWFAAKVALGAVAVNYFLGPVVGDRVPRWLVVGCAEPSRGGRAVSRPQSTLIRRRAALAPRPSRGDRAVGAAGPGRPDPGPDPGCGHEGPGRAQGEGVPLRLLCPGRRHRADAIYILVIVEKMPEDLLGETADLTRAIHKALGGLGDDAYKEIDLYPDRRSHVQRMEGSTRHGSHYDGRQRGDAACLGSSACWRTSTATSSPSTPPWPVSARWAAIQSSAPGT